MIHKKYLVVVTLVLANLIVFSTNVRGDYFLDIDTDIYCSSPIQYDNTYEWVDVDGDAEIEGFEYNGVNASKFVAYVNGGAGVKADYYHQEEELEVTMHAYAIVEKEWSWSGGGIPVGGKFYYVVLNDEPNDAFSYGYLYGTGYTYVTDDLSTHAAADTWAFSGILPPDEYPYYGDPAVQVMSGHSIDACDNYCSIDTSGTGEYTESYGADWYEYGIYYVGYYGSSNLTHYHLEIVDNIVLSVGESILDVRYGVQVYYDHDLYAEVGPYSYDDAYAFVDNFTSFACLCVVTDFQRNEY
jgi:hypothetical protein